MKHLVLVGGGHAHLAVLKAFAKQTAPKLRLTLITPSPTQTYSGMLPGWLAGHYSLEDCQIHLRPLVAAAVGELILDHMTSLDADQQVLETASGRVISYDLLSINTGSETAFPDFTKSDKFLTIRPLEGLSKAWPEILKQAQQPRYQLAVLGGGAAGLELAFAMQYAFQQQALTAKVHLVAPELLSDHAPAVQKQVYKHLNASGIKWHPSRAQFAQNHLLLETGETLQVQKVFAATGAKAPAWLASSGLALDLEGYLQVNAQHQSLSHPSIFAAGDVCARPEPEFGRSGVHAVYAGKVLAHNLPAYFNQEPLLSYYPKKRSLYLLATGSKEAIASWGRFSVSGAWVWLWKNYIDQSFMQQYRLSIHGLAASEQKL